MTDWSKHVHRFAKKHNMSYKQANVSKKCKEAYKKRKTSPRRKSPRRKTSPRRRMNPPTKKYGANLIDRYLELLTDKELEENSDKIEEEIRRKEETIKRTTEQYNSDLESLELPETAEDDRRIERLLERARSYGQTLEEIMEEDISDTRGNIGLLMNADDNIKGEKEKRKDEEGFESEKKYKELRDTYRTYAGRASHLESSPAELERELKKATRWLQKKKGPFR